MATAHIFRVFTDAQGHMGDKASIVIDEGRHISDKKRQAIAQEFNTGETIFINNLKNADISVMHPQGEISFAGVGVLATAWFLKKMHSKSIEKLIGRDGDIAIREEGDILWIQTSIETLPKWNIKYLQNAANVDHITLEETSEIKHTLFWSWIDEKKRVYSSKNICNRLGYTRSTRKWIRSNAFGTSARSANPNKTR